MYFEICLDLMKYGNIGYWSVETCQINDRKFTLNLKVGHTCITLLKFKFNYTRSNKTNVLFCNSLTYPLKGYKLYVLLYVSVRDNSPPP